MKNNKKNKIFSLSTVITLVALSFLATASYADVNQQGSTGNSSTNTDTSANVTTDSNNTTTSTNANNTTTSTNSGNTTTNSNNTTTNPVAGSSSSNVSVSQNTPRVASTSTAPALTSGGNDSCMGSSSGGAQGLSFGVSLGSTWTDQDCVRRKDATFMHNMGQATIALAIMCQSPNVRAAVESVGTPAQKAICNGTNAAAATIHAKHVEATRPNKKPCDTVHNHSNGGYNQ